MKNILRIIFFLLFCFSYSQKHQNIKATYLFINSNINPMHEVVHLFINKEFSFTQFLRAIKKDSIFEDDENNLFFYKEVVDSIGKQVLIENKQITFRDFFYKNRKNIPVKVIEPKPELNWVLVNEKIEIAKNTCYKALLNFRGRNYIAWYAPEIPTPFGPWKFHGLPGLIFRIESDDKTIKFDLEKIEIADFNKKEISGEVMDFNYYKNNRLTGHQEDIDKLKSKMPKNVTVSVNYIKITDLELNFD